MTTITDFFTYDPYVIFDDAEFEFDADLDISDIADPSLDSAEGEALLLGITQYS